MSLDILANLTLPTQPKLVAPTNNQEDEKIWTRILSEVSSKSRSNLQGSVIVLGDNHSGKTSLLTKLEKIDNPNKGSALEYHFLNVQTDLRDSSYAYSLGTAGGLGPADSLTLPVWLLDGNEVFSPLLKFALPSTSPSRAVVLLTAALDNPGIILSLRRWANVIAQQVNAKYDKATINEARQAQVRFWQEYMEPVESSMTSSMHPALDDTGLLPLEQGVLSENTGVSMVVVITKSDLCSQMSDHQADRLLVQIRRFCLQHGAALIYTSTKTNKNAQLLTKYIIHRAFALPFTQPAQLIDRDSLFVPAGWDGEKKIEIIKEGVPDADIPLEPTREKTAVIKEPLIEAEDNQAFLNRLLQMEASAPLAMPPSTPKNTLIDKGTDGSTPLASFFSNLLKDKPGSKSGALPADAGAHLDRILQGTKSSGSGSEKESSA